MKLNNHFITHQTEEEHIMISTDTEKFSGIVKSNETAGFIIESIKQEISKQSLLQLMQATYDAPEEVLLEEIDRVLSVLHNIGALDE